MNSNYKSHKFDGPSFVNPNHTNQALGNSGNYQHPTYTPSVANQKKEDAKKQNKKGPKGIKIIKIKTRLGER